MEDDLDPSRLYVLTNNYTGDEYHLAYEAPNRLYMRSSSLPSSTAIHWRLVETERGGYYRFHSVASDSRALDVINDNDVNSTRLELAQTGNFSGQFWSLGEWGDGTYKLSNLFTGPDRHLDVYSDTLQPHLAGDDRTGQHWTLTPVEPDQDSRRGDEGPGVEVQQGAPLTNGFHHDDNDSEN